MSVTSKFAHLHKTFRKRFTLPRKGAVNWYPGHMMKGMLQIQAKLRSVDCIMEIHDARIPFSGRNLKLREIIQLRPHILILNKSDLIDSSSRTRQNIVKKLQEEHEVDTVFYTNLKTDHKMTLLKKVILPKAIELIDSQPRYSREGVDSYNLLVLGVPNVGKSTFINNLRAASLKKGGKATTVGSKAGITKSVLSKIKVSENPPVYIIDTPGIMPPKVANLETGMRLAACACLPDAQVGFIEIADYVLFWLNKHRQFAYVDYFNLEAPSDVINDVLFKVALLNRRFLKIKDIATGKEVLRPNFNDAAWIFFNTFREGKLGKHVLDDDLLPKK